MTFCTVISRVNFLQKIIRVRQELTFCAHVTKNAGPAVRAAVTAVGIPALVQADFVTGALDLSYQRRKRTLTERLVSPERESHATVETELPASDFRLGVRPPVPADGARLSATMNNHFTIDFLITVRATVQSQCEGSR